MLEQISKCLFELLLIQNSSRRQTFSSYMAPYRIAQLSRPPNLLTYYVMFTSRDHRHICLRIKS